MASKHYRNLTWTCLRKRRYLTWEAAERAALDLMEDIRSGVAKHRKPGPVTAYKCKFDASHYHIGHDHKPRLN